MSYFEPTKEIHLGVVWIMLFICTNKRNLCWIDMYVNGAVYKNFAHRVFEIQEVQKGYWNKTIGLEGIEVLSS